MTYSLARMPAVISADRLERLASLRLSCWGTFWIVG